MRLIVADSYWRYFHPYIPGSREIISNKLDEISSVRNSLAHFRPIKEDDIQLVKQNARHVLSRIELCLTDMMRCANTVPTNTLDEWYLELATLGTDHCRFSFKQSDDEQWVKVSFEYDCPILAEKGSENYRRYRVLSLNSPAILHSCPALQGLLIFLSERIPWPGMKDGVPGFRKSVAMVFSRAVIAQDHIRVKRQIEHTLLTVSEETALLLDDSLARGEIVQAVDANASRRGRNGESGYWGFDTQGLKCSVAEDDPPEYWGQLKNVSDDYVTSTDSYPWMPVTVSREEIPF